MAFGLQNMGAGLSPSGADAEKKKRKTASMAKFNTGSTPSAGLSSSPASAGVQQSASASDAQKAMIDALPSGGQASNPSAAANVQGAMTGAGSQLADITKSLQGQSSLQQGGSGFQSNSSQAGERLDGKPPPPEGPPPGPNDDISEMDQIYNDMMQKQDESWKQTQELLQAQAAANTRRAQSMQGTLGRSVAGGYAGALGQANILSQQQMQQAAIQNQQQMQQIMMDRAQKKWSSGEAEAERDWRSSESSEDRAHRMDMLSAELESQGLPPDVADDLEQMAADGATLNEMQEEMKRRGIKGAAAAAAGMLLMGPMGGFAGGVAGAAGDKVTGGLKKAGSWAKDKVTGWF